MSAATQSNRVLIVAGFGRCGSSLLMQMLHAGGTPCYGLPPAFEDAERTEIGLLSTELLHSMRGKAIKILDPQRGHQVRFHTVPRCIIWLDRDPLQQAKSFAKFGSVIFGLRFNRSQVKAMAAMFPGDRIEATNALGTDHCPTLRLRFEDIITAPLPTAQRIAQWLPVGFPFDADKASRIVRKRSSDCLPYLLEPELLDAYRQPETAA